MYYKIVKGVTIYSDCKTVRLEDGRWQSNPSARTIERLGWKICTQTEPGFDAIISDLKAYIRADVDALTDEQALAVKSLFPTFPEIIGKEVSPGLRIWYDGKLYKCIQLHSVQEDWTPDITPSLWTEITLDEWPAWKQPLGSEDAYNTGDKVSHNDKHWESSIDNNIWEPGIYGWTEV